MFLLRKWYFDLLTRDGMFLYVYFAYTRLAGVTTRSLVLHIAPEGSGKTLTLPLPVESHREQNRDGRELNVGLKGGAIRVDRMGCHIAAGNSDASVDLSYTPVIPGGTRPVLIEGAGPGHILWEPIGIRYRVDGFLTIKGSRQSVGGCAGYADFLESTILPLRVPVRHLFWGRAHRPEADLTFMHASGAAGTPSWSRLILHREGKVEESSGVEIAAMKPGGYVVRARPAGHEFQMSVTHVKMVQNDSFIDQQGIRWPIARSLVKKITRNPRGSKFLSKVDVPGWGDDGSLMIDEEAFL